MNGPIRVVTVSRQYGAGGAEFAARFGAALGWPVHDRSISEQAAERLAASSKSVSDAEERELSYLERLEELFSAGSPEMLIGMQRPVVPWNEQVFAAEREAILRLAGSPPAVIVGRGAQCILHREEGVLHVRIYSPIAERVERISGRTGTSAEDAERALRGMDAARSKFLKAHFGCDETQDTLYDVELNSASLPVDEAVELVAWLVRRRS